MVESIAVPDVMSLLLGSSVGAVIPFGAAGTEVLVEAGVKRHSDGALSNNALGTADCIPTAWEISAPGLVGAG